MSDHDSLQFRRLGLLSSRRITLSPGDADTAEAQRWIAVAMSMKERKIMITRRIEMERFSVVSSKPFQAVLAALNAAVGHPDMAEFARAAKAARTLADLEDVVRRGLGKTGLMMFMEFDHGAILRKETGLDAPKIVRVVMGNPLIKRDRKTGTDDVYGVRSWRNYMQTNRARLTQDRACCDRQSTHHEGNGETC